MGSLDWGIMENETWNHAPVVVYPIGDNQACTVKTEAYCAHTNSVHNTFSFYSVNLLAGK